MSEYPKYLRIVMELEVEIVDPVAAKAYTFDIGREADGSTSFAPAPPDEHIAQAVSQMFAEGARAAQEQSGIKWISGSTLPRYVDENGAYGEITLPSMPRRLDDGAMVWPEGMEPPA